MNFSVIVMISRKERRIQRALGTEGGMPPTIYARIRKRAHRLQRWIHSYTYRWTVDAFWQWCAFKLPKKLAYHCTIRVWAHATTCPSGRTEIAGETTMENAIKRWEKE